MRRDTIIASFAFFANHSLICRQSGFTRCDWGTHQNKDLHQHFPTRVICGRYNNISKAKNPVHIANCREQRGYAMYSHCDLSSTGSQMYFFCGRAWINTEGRTLIWLLVQHHQWMKQSLDVMLLTDSKQPLKTKNVLK